MNQSTQRMWLVKELIYAFVVQDIAILTNNVTNCVYYQQESANVKSRFACVLPTETVQANVNNKGKKFIIPNNQAGCEVSIFLLAAVVRLCTHAWYALLNLTHFQGSLIFVL